MQNNSLVIVIFSNEKLPSSGEIVKFDGKNFTNTFLGHQYTNNYFSFSEKDSVLFVNDCFGKLKEEEFSKFQNDVFEKYQDIELILIDFMEPSFEQYQTLIGKDKIKQACILLLGNMRKPQIAQLENIQNKDKVAIATMVVDKGYFKEEWLIQEWFKELFTQEQFKEWPENTLGPNVNKIKGFQDFFSEKNLQMLARADIDIINIVKTMVIQASTDCGNKFCPLFNGSEEDYVEKFNTPLLEARYALIDNKNLYSIVCNLLKNYPDPEVPYSSGKMLELLCGCLSEKTIKYSDSVFNKGEPKYFPLSNYQLAIYDIRSSEYKEISDYNAGLLKQMYCDMAQKNFGDKAISICVSQDNVSCRLSNGINEKQKNELQEALRYNFQLPITINGSKNDDLYSSFALSGEGVVKKFQDLFNEKQEQPSTIKEEVVTSEFAGNQQTQTRK